MFKVLNAKGMTADQIADLLYVWFLGMFSGNDTRNDFYCGITNAPETRIRDHVSNDYNGKEINNIIVYECDSVDISFEVEKLMGNKGFDIGNPPHEGNGAAIDSCYIYLFKKPR